ncbi:hypothetical protein SUGI_1085720 [Cryptomeria japonica]|nr:hypothetical protein SUGI_1085720 [Cryptomeria japonica]
MRSFFSLSLLLCVVMLVKANYTSVRVSNHHYHNYREALSKAILFFEGQRSGKLPTNQRIEWRRDSGLSDGVSAHVDLTGGYHDAGDNVKFGFPMAFTTTMLPWGVLEFGGFMGSDLSNAKTAIRWATDYLLKATSHPGTIYVQVGDPNNDHKCWERPEDMDTARTAYKIDSQNPGSDVAAETAAALAAASLVFRKTDPSYSKRLIHASMMSAVCPFYCSYSGYQDELLWGAAWLHKATKNAQYLNYIQANGQSLGADESDNIFGWFNKNVGARVLLSNEFLVDKVQSLQDFKSLADKYVCAILPRSKYTPGGLLYLLPEVNLHYVTSASFVLLTYAKYLSSSKQLVSCGGVTVTPRRIRAIKRRQVDYILGSNPLEMSYMVGYGSKYPQRIHHRGSSLPSVAQQPQAIGCIPGFQFLNSNASNPNLLVGAVVGGPDANDHFPDDRHDYQHSEPTTYINAPLLGSLAYLAHSTHS